MIGMIVCGHGHYASGLTSGVKLIAGMPEKYKTVDFLQEDTTDDFEMHLKDAIKELAECKDLLIFTDLVESTPYKIAVQLKHKYADTLNIHVVAGCNLGMVVQANMARGYVSDLYDLADLAVEEGKKQILFYDSENKPVEEEEE